MQELRRIRVSVSVVLVIYLYIREILQKSQLISKSHYLIVVLQRVNINIMRLIKLPARFVFIVITLSLLVLSLFFLNLENIRTQAAANNNEISEDELQDGDTIFVGPVTPLPRKQLSAEQLEEELRQNTQFIEEMSKLTEVTRRYGPETYGTQLAVSGTVLRLPEDTFIKDYTSRLECLMGPCTIQSPVVVWIGVELLL